MSVQCGFHGVKDHMIGPVTDSVDILLLSADPSKLDLRPASPRCTDQLKFEAVKTTLTASYQALTSGPQTSSGDSRNPLHPGRSE